MNRSYEWHKRRFQARVSAAERQQVAAHEMAKLRAQIPKDNESTHEVNQDNSDGELANAQLNSVDGDAHPDQLKQPAEVAEVAEVAKSLFRTRRSMAVSE